MAVPPKIGRQYWQIAKKGCSKNDNGQCSYDYGWDCEICPVTIEEKITQEIIRRNAEPFRKCEKCEQMLPMEDFHFHGRDRRGIPYKDKICKFCRSETHKQYTQDVKKRGFQRVKDYLSFDRSTKDKFIFYMQNNPYYFESTFEKPATLENIHEEFQNLFVN